MTAEEAIKILYEMQSKTAYSGELGGLAVNMAVEALIKQEEPVSEDLKEAADKYESEQQEKYKDRDNHDFDNYRDGFVDGLTYTYDAFKAGAQWQKRKTIDKACEWLEKHCIEYWGTEAIDNGKMIDDFRKALEKGDKDD